VAHGQDRDRELTTEYSWQNMVVPNPLGDALRIIDLSAPIVPSPPETPEFQRNDVTFLDHAAGAAEIEAIYGVPSELLRDGEGWTRETITLGTHNSTHVDAPYHYNSRIQGEPAQTIDQLPLERFFGPGVVVDVTDLEDGQAVTAERMAAGIDAAGHTLGAGDIVLMRTDRDRFYGQADYIDRGPGVTAEATRWLFHHGVRVMGIDAWGWDRPLRMQAADALRDHATEVFWEAHQADLPYSQIERLVNLSSLPATGFTVACFPLRIQGASAAPARVVALVGS
jgi:kynurenine formamidase